MTDAQEQELIDVGLKRIRHLRMGIWVIVIVFVPLVYLLVSMNVPEAVVMAIGVAWVCFGVIIELMLGFFRCPACNKYFHVRGMRGNVLVSKIFTKKCMNCGIQLKQHGFRH